MADEFPEWSRRIRVARYLSRLTQLDVASRLGMHQMALSSWERGRTQPSLERFEDLGRILKCEAVWLAFGLGRGPHGWRDVKMEDLYPAA
jgi:transcriptional regulator with XRE-family HTH domain